MFSASSIWRSRLDVNSNAACRAPHSNSLRRERRLLASAASAAGLVLGVELFDLVEEAGSHLVGLVDEPHGDQAVKHHRVTNGADSVPLWVAETPDNIHRRLTRAHAQEVLFPRVGFDADADARVVAFANSAVLLQRVYVDALSVWRVGDAVSVPFHEVEECLCATGNIFRVFPFSACCVGLLKCADKVGGVAVHARPCFATLGCERAQVVARDGGCFSCPCHASHVSFCLFLFAVRLICVAPRDRAFNERTRGSARC